MRGRHRLPHGAEEISTQFVEVDFVREAIRKGIECDRSVVPRAIKAPVDRALHTASDGLEERIRDQCCNGDRELRSGSKRTEHSLKSHDAPEKHRRDRGGRRAVDQSAVDEQVNVVEAIAKYRDANRDRRRREASADSNVGEGSVGQRDPDCE